MSASIPALSAKAKAALPRHVAIIMDGNGRWAKARGFSRIEGHRRGSDSVRATMKVAADLGIEYLTLFAFSSENWTRPEDEISALMGYLTDFIRKETPNLQKNKTNVRVIGDTERLPANVQTDLQYACETLTGFDGPTLVVALSYGSRAEILRATRSLAASAVAGEIRPEDIDEPMFSDRLYTRGIPDPDLLIRTSGEMRVSNFLLWQISYTEFVVSPTLWPDFREKEFIEAIEEFAQRDRRFGGI